MKEGDFLKVEYTGRLVTGELFDTTDEHVAKKENAFNPKQRYGPVLVIIGAGMAVPGVERNLKEMKEGEEREFSLKPQEAFGPRDFKRIRIISLSKFIKDKVNPYPGAFINIDGQDAKVQSVSGGRVRVDFNHPLAGRELKYRLKLLFRIEKAEEKAASLLDHYGITGEPIKAGHALKGSVLEITTEKPIQEPMGGMISSPIKKWIPEIKEVKFSLRGEKKAGKPPATPEAPEQKPDAATPPEPQTESGK